jgi:hypothetical protein
MSSKLNEVFKLNEEAIDPNVKSGSPQQVLKMVGVNKNEIKTPQDLQSVITHLSRMINSMFGGLAGKTKPGIDKPNPGSPNIANVNPALEKAVDEAMNAIRKLAKTPAMDPAKAPKAEPQSQEDPRTGYADDPNPKTRNTRFPNRSYRAG